MNETAFRARFLVFAPQHQSGGHSWRNSEPDAWVLAADSDLAYQYLDGNTHIVDAFVDNRTVPGPGVWVWEGWVWSYMSGYYEPECESGEHLDCWRRASAEELWRFRQGEPVFRAELPKPYPCVDSHMPGVSP